MLRCRSWTTTPCAPFPPWCFTQERSSTEPVNGPAVAMGGLMATLTAWSAMTFQEALKSDFVGLRNVMARESWKAAQVLAGSIVEATLIDYLFSSVVGAPVRSDDGKAVSVCGQRTEAARRRRQRRLGPSRRSRRA